MPAEGSLIQQRATEEFFFPELNPGQETTLWWPNPVVIVMKGQVWVKCRVEPEDISKATYKTFQFNRFGDAGAYGTPNEWGSTLLIRGELEQEQAKTNFLIFVLALLVFLEGVWGLSTIFKTMFKVFGWLFSQVGELFNALGGIS